LEEELGSHIQLRANELERSGCTPAEAKRRARIEFGSQERFKEERREALAGNLIDTMIQDVRFSFLAENNVGAQCVWRSHGS